MVKPKRPRPAKISGKSAIPMPKQSGKSPSRKQPRGGSGK